MFFLGTKIAEKEAAREENVCGKAYLFFYESRAGTQLGSHSPVDLPPSQGTAPSRADSKRTVMEASPAPAAGQMLSAGI